MDDVTWSVAGLLGQEAGAMLAARLLAPVLGAGAGTPGRACSASCRAWLGENGSWDATAKATGLHRNSVRRQIGDSRGAAGPGPQPGPGPGRTLDCPAVHWTGCPGTPAAPEPRPAPVSRPRNGRSPAGGRAGMHGSPRCLGRGRPAPPPRRTAVPGPAPAAARSDAVRAGDDAAAQEVATVLRPGVVGIGHRQLVLQRPGPDQHLRHGVESVGEGRRHQQQVGAAHRGGRGPPQGTRRRSRSPARS